MRRRFLHHTRFALLVLACLIGAALAQGEPAPPGTDARIGGALAPRGAEATTAPQGTTATDLPDLCPVLALMPAAATMGPPPVVHVGSRLLYFGATASVPGERTELVPDPEGRWLDEATGQRYGEHETPGAAAAAFTLVRVGYLDAQVAQLNQQLYLWDPGNGDRHVHVRARPRVPRGLRVGLLGAPGGARGAPRAPRRRRAGGAGAVPRSASAPSPPSGSRRPPRRATPSTSTTWTPA